MKLQWPNLTLSLRICLISLCFVASSCAGHRPTIVTTPNSGISQEQANRAYTADQIVQRVGELQNVAIKAEAAKQLPTATTRIIVTWCVQTAETLKPENLKTGWQQTLQEGWKRVKEQLGSQTDLTVSSAMGAVDIALASLGGQQ